MSPRSHLSKWITSDKTLNAAQTIGIIATLFITLIFGIRGEHSQYNRDSADFMLKFDEHLNSGSGGIIARTLDREGSLDNLQLDQKDLDDALSNFFGNYDLLNEVYMHHLIDDDMSYDAFVYDLEKALKDKKAREYLANAIHEDSDLFAGVFELAKSWDIKFQPIVP